MSLSPFQHLTAARRALEVLNTEHYPINDPATFHVAVAQAHALVALADALLALERSVMRIAGRL